MTHSQPNIILVGFMASGKSRIGEMLSKRLGYELFDLDAIIERETKKSIKEIFAQKGEWYFRGLESKAIKDLKNRDHAIIVTGGGAPMCFENVSVLKQLGQIFYLDANLSLIIKRLKANDVRPLGNLVTEHDYEKIRELYQFRRPVYLGIGQAIDVNHENKTKTCDDIIERFKAHNRLVKLSKTTVHDALFKYEIYLGLNSLNHVQDVISSIGLMEHRPVIITSDALFSVLKPKIDQIKEKLQNEASIVTFKDGEQHKTSASIHHIHSQMFSLGLTRKTIVIALGGGNVGDVAGFASSIFLRGVPFVQIPTTLLAMVDASIGGKTGIDLDIGKNLIGAFHNPRAVIIDPTLLSTLPKEDFSCGMAEVIKHAIIADTELFEILKNQELDLIKVIERAIKVKADIVFSDPKESNIRAHLNLGHTFAHAIEKVSNYRIKHGAAVAIGLMNAIKLSKSLGILEEDFVDDLENLLKKFELPTSLPTNIKKSDLLSAMKFDKKRDNQALKFVLLRKLGDVFVGEVDDHDVFDY